jgi:sortase A
VIVINWRNTLVLVCLLGGLWQLADAIFISAKAEVAQELIAKAWARSLLKGGQPIKPWPWADTWPIARLVVPRHSIDLYVLAGAAGNALAFGPGHVSASAFPGERGVSVIGGHRDTHFSFLQALQHNTLLKVELSDGSSKTYRVAQMKVVDATKEALPGFFSTESELMLVTCYPFDALFSGGPLRYVVKAFPVGAGAATSLAQY